MSINLLSGSFPNSFVSVAFRGAACGLLTMTRGMAALSQQTKTSATPNPLSIDQNQDFHLHDLQRLTQATVVQERFVPLSKTNTCLTGHARHTNFAAAHHQPAFSAIPLQQSNMMSALSEMRSNFPPDFWQHITRLFPDRLPQRPVCVDVAVSVDGSSGIFLAQKAGFHVIGVEADANLLAKTFAVAQSAHADIELMTAKVEESLIHNDSIDIVTFLHGLHMIDTERALKEAWRILKPQGKLVAAWNDRDLGSHFTREIEDIVEKHIPTYSRFQKQRSMEEWGERLTAGGLFQLQQYSVYRHPMIMKNAGALVDLLNCMSFVRAGLRGESRKRFNQELRALIERRYGRNRPFDFPLETKMYVLEKIPE